LTGGHQWKDRTGSNEVGGGVELTPQDRVTVLPDFGSEKIRGEGEGNPERLCPKRSQKETIWCAFWWNSFQELDDNEHGKAQPRGDNSNENIKLRGKVKKNT